MQKAMQQQSNYERADIASIISNSTTINKATKEALLRNFVGIYNNQ